MFYTAYRKKEGDDNTPELTMLEYGQTKIRSTINPKLDENERMISEINRYSDLILNNSK